MFVVQRISWMVQRRQIGLSSRSCSVLNSIWDRVKGFLTESEKENFHEEFIRKSHKSDQISSNEWMLIYRDQGASRSFLIVSIVFPAFLASVAIFGYELYAKAEADRNQMVQRLVKDAREVGLLAILPCAAISTVICFLLRINQLRILRIYQNKKNVDDYLAIGSKLVVKKHQIPYNRVCASACYFSEEKTGIGKLLTQVILGNMQIENRRFFISDDGFIANNYRSYMLNETSAPPRLR